MKKSQSGEWFRVLEAARRVGSRVGRGGPEALPFTASDLAMEAEIGAGAKGSPASIASAWIGKFVRWGYAKVHRAEKRFTAGHPVMYYVLTRWGMEFQPRKRIQKVAGKE